MKKSVVVQSLQFRYILGLSVIAILVTIAYFSMQNLVSQQRSYSQIVNIAGHQSGLVNRIAYFAGLMATTDDLNEFNMAKSQVGRTINKIENNNNILNYGSHEEGIGYVTNEKLKIIYGDNAFGLNVSLQRFLKHAGNVYKSDMDKLSVQSIEYIYLSNYGPYVLEPMIEDAVDEYRNVGREAIYKIEQFELIIWLTTIFVLILEALFIFNPLVKKVEDSIVLLNKSIHAHEMSEGRLLEAQELASLGDWQLNLEDNTLTWTDEIYRIFSLNPDTFVPTMSAILQFVHPEDRSAVEEMLKQTRVNNVRGGMEHRVICPDGSERIVYNQSIAHYSEDGQIISLTGTIQDITEQKQVQQELELYRNNLENLVEERTLALQSACEEADQANKAKSEFLSSMSHELRTPLNAIIGFSEMLEEYGEETSIDERQNYIGHVIKAGFHLLDLINDILDLSRIDAGYLDINIKPLHLNIIINETINQIEASIASKCGINLIFQDNNKNQYILADSLRLKQIMMNLLSNAVKYNREGGSVTIKSETVSNDKLRISITDTGKGIAAADIDKLFEPFERLSYNNSKVEGTGIGLTITKQLVEAMGGNIGVDSSINQGSTFWVDMPYDISIRLPVADKIDSPTKLRKITAFKHTILYIEDNTVNAQLVMDALIRRGGYEVIISTTAEQGLTVAEEEIPDLILMDITLPGIDGITAFNILKSMEKTKNIPVIAVTANAMAADVKNGLDTGFDEYITKPINIQNLYLMIDKHMPSYLASASHI